MGGQIYFYYVKQLQWITRWIIIKLKLNWLLFHINVYKFILTIRIILQNVFNLIFFLFALKDNLNSTINFMLVSNVFENVSDGSWQEIQNNWKNVILKILGMWFL